MPQQKTGKSSCLQMFGKRDPSLLNLKIFLQISSKYYCDDTIYTFIIPQLLEAYTYTK